MVCPVFKRGRTWTNASRERDPSTREGLDRGNNAACNVPLGERDQVQDRT